MGDCRGSGGLHYFICAKADPSSVLFEGDFLAAAKQSSVQGFDFAGKS